MKLSLVISAKKAPAKLRMRVLLVGMIDSVHLARWIAQIADCDWEIVVFPSTESERVHPMLARLNVKTLHVRRLQHMIAKTKNGLLRMFLAFLHIVFSKLMNPRDRSACLSRVIRQFDPHILHSVETQNAGYLVEETKRRFFSQKSFPPWLHTNWGSDIFLFGKLPAHRDRIREVLRVCNFYSCESKRDVVLAREFGFSGKVVACFPNAGGFDLASIRAMREQTLTSARKRVLLKGYQGWAGRALVGIKALALLGENLKEFEVVIYGNSEGRDIAIAGELLSYSTGAKVTILPHVAHDEMLKYFASARVYIGLSISDSISTSLLEAMAMGAFPVQSNTSTAEEWIRDGETGAIVPAEEPLEISARILQALREDDLVDRAGVENWKVIAQRADGKVLKEMAAEIYSSIARAGAVKK